MYFKNGHGSILLIGNMVIVKTEKTRAIVKIKDLSIRKSLFHYQVHIFKQLEELKEPIH